MAEIVLRKVLYLVMLSGLGSRCIPQNLKQSLQSLGIYNLFLYGYWFHSGKHCFLDNFLFFLESH